MNCCVNCFADQGVRDRIEAESNGKGLCDFCESKDVFLIACEELSDVFDALFELYINHPTAVLSLKDDRSVAMHEHLICYWPKLFDSNKLKPKDVKQLLNQIGRGWVGFKESLFEEPVELQIYLNGEATDDSHRMQWEKFASEIKEENRFFIANTLDLELLESTFSRFAKTYPVGTHFYRARISDRHLKSMSWVNRPSCIQHQAEPIQLVYRIYIFLKVKRRPFMKHGFLCTSPLALDVLR